jgi:hypothetical protein
MSPHDSTSNPAELVQHGDFAFIDALYPITHGHLNGVDISYQSAEALGFD